jgi:lipopolysaccharide export system protein LptA
MTMPPLRHLGFVAALAAGLAAGPPPATAAQAASAASTTTAPAKPADPVAGGTALDPGNATGPVEIDAEQGIEWRRDEKVYIARGNARVKRGDITLNADTLTAHYEGGGESDGGKVTRVVAEGGVKISTPTQTVYGDKAEYDLNQGVMVITGKALRAVTPTQTLTARDRFEYWTKREIVVARGDAVVTEPGKRVSADLLTGYFATTPEGKRELRQVEADGHVVITDKSEVARGQKAIYDLKRGIATLSGGVKITRGQNQLNGEYAEVNLNTGVSRLLGAAKGKGDGRVHTLIVPGDSGADGLFGGTGAKPSGKKSP